MSARWARSLLGMYRIAGGAIYPFVGGYVRWRAKRGKEEYDRRRERYGHAGVERPDGPLIWVHAVSVGETAAVIPLIESLMAMGIQVVLTTGTVTSAKLASDRLSADVIHQYVPLDLTKAVKRFLDFWKPDLAITAESEIWPMIILELGARRIPQVVVNGRLSDSSYNMWRKRRYLSEALMENLALVIAQSDVDAERFRDIGARPVTVSGNLKADSPPPPFDPAELALLKLQTSGRPIWIAASTHEGEEEIAGIVHRGLAKRFNRLLTLIVPRHPARSDAIEALLIAQGHKVSRRSKGDKITPETDIYIGDTIGEMGLFFRLSPVAFIGNSLVGEGGQNPLEPAILGAAVLSGPNISNFREAYSALVRNGGARLVKDTKDLGMSVSVLLSDPERCSKMGNAGSQTVIAMQGALDHTLETLDPHIRPLMMKASLASHNNLQQKPNDAAKQ